MKHIPLYMWRQAPTFYHQHPPHLVASIERSAALAVRMAKQCLGDSAMMVGRMDRLEAAHALIACGDLHAQLTAIMQSLTHHVNGLVQAGKQTFPEDFSIEKEAEVRTDPFDIFAVWQEMKENDAP